MDKLLHDAAWVLLIFGGIALLGEITRLTLTGWDKWLDGWDF